MAYPTLQERVVKKWIEVDMPDLYEKVESTRKKRPGSSWLEALQQVNPDAVKVWKEEGERESITKRLNMMRRPVSGINK